MQKFTIVKSKWKNGSYRKAERGSASLLNNQGYMCCLGFITNQCGVDNSELLHVPDPEELREELHVKIPFLIKTEGPDAFNSDLAKDAIAINDEPSYSEEVRIALLTDLFRKYDIELEFV